MAALLGHGAAARNTAYHASITADTSCDTAMSPSTRTSTGLSADAATDSSPPLSLFEAIVTAYPPVLESLLAQLPTAAVLDLYHTSRHLRAFLAHYPLAWRTLSFRLPQPVAPLAIGSPGIDTPDSRERQSRPYAFDALLKHVLAPHGTRLTSLDLCNTAVTGIALVGNVLAPRIATLRHLSVRGCKNVSIKYHIVPFLEPYTLPDAPWARTELALRSLYTYRCRHHRRRPYLPSSLIRRDSDSDPTHQLIEICHQLGIWTDTAWCPTPGGRCNRRKEYHQGRASPQNLEVWVPFDRLWRSGNRIGPVEGAARPANPDGRLWEVADSGQDGEPLGPCNSGYFAGEGKHMPVYQRRSHTLFVDHVKCSQCQDVILERCESCSVRMHCMGCRKTLCASCAFNKPIPRQRIDTRHFTNLAFGNSHIVGGALGQASGSAASLLDTSQQPQAEKNRFWWAPGASRSPNLMMESTLDDESSDSEEGGATHNGILLPPGNREPPKLNMRWCCLEPIFSGGGGIAVHGTGLGGRGADKIRAAPLPRTKEFEDPDFGHQLRPVDYIRELKSNGLYEYVLGEDVDLLSYLKQESLDLQQNTCPRGLCQDCYRSFKWKVSCRACKSPICKEHDFRALKVRKCGYRDLHTEREHVRSHNEPLQRLVIPKFNPNRAIPPNPERTPSAASHNDLYATADNESQSLEPPMSQSQVLFAPPMLTSVDMSATTSFNSTITNDPFHLAASPSYLPISSSRPRSYSVSGVRGRHAGPIWPTSPRPNPNPITNPLPLPCHPRHPVQWEGCGAYFCKNPRPVGDGRELCTAILKECSECAVLVCDQCVSLNPRCTCTFCTMNYHCPACTRKPHIRIKCRLDAEIKAKKDAELRAQARIAKDREERGHADDLAGAMLEFFTGVFEDADGTATSSHHIMNGASNGSTRASSLGEAMPLPLPLPSPDSITVTTEFGVSEEPAHVNVTTVTAGVAPWQVLYHHHQYLPPMPQQQLYHHHQQEENQVEMTENVHEAMDWTQNTQQNDSIHQDPMHEDVAVDEMAEDSNVNTTSDEGSENDTLTHTTTTTVGT